MFSVGNKIIDALAALLIFLCTTYLSGNTSYLPLILFSVILFLSSDFKLVKKNKMVFFIFLIFLGTQCFLMFFDFFINDRYLLSIGNPFFGFLTFILMIVVTKIISLRVLLYVIYFICFEVLIAVFEYLIGQPYLFEAQLKSAVGDISSLSSFSKHSFDFYRNSVYGLGSTSSNLSFKIIFFLLVAKVSGIKLGKTVVGLFIVGSILSFSRMAIICLLIYFFIEFYKFKYTRMLTPILFLLFLFVIYSYSDVFLKGYALDFETLFSDKVLNAITSSRYEIWSRFMESSPSNWLFGYYGETKSFDVGYVITTNPHNTYLYLFFKHGVVGILLYMAALYLAFSREYWLYLVPILLYSVTSVTLGFYFSIYDVIIFYLLFNLSYSDTQRTDNDIYCKKI